MQGREPCIARNIITPCCTLIQNNKARDKGHHVPAKPTRNRSKADAAEHGADIARIVGVSTSDAGISSQHTNRKAVISTGRE